MAITITTASGQQFRYVRKTNGRSTPAELKQTAPTPRERTLTVAGGGAHIRLIYGRDSVPGQIALQGFIGGDLVLAVVWGYGELEEIEEVFINSESIPVGVTQTHYTGTTSQTVDTTLSTAIPAFNDDMVLRTPRGDVGIAYSVFRIPTGEIDGAPRFRAIIKGRKLYDPRTDTVAYSDNSALCFGDLVTNPVFGLGTDILGLAEAADWCDSLIDGSFERAKLSLTLTRPLKTPQYMNQLATYAECLWCYEGRNVRVVPDKIVDATNASGQDVVQNGGFADETAYAAEDYFAEDYNNDPVGPFWTLGDGWDIYGGQATVDGTQSAASSTTQTVSTVATTEYGLSVTIDSVSAGSLAVEIDGVEFINESSPGTYTALFTADDADAAVELVASSDFVGAVASVSLRALYWTEKNCIEGSLRVDGLDDSDSPTRVITRWKEPSSSTPEWREQQAPVTLAGVEEGDLPLIETSQDMPGIFRVSEAGTKSNARLQRLINPVRVTWTTTDIGIRHRLGDVIRHKMDRRGTDILVKLDAVRMVDYGRYEVTGLRYDPAHYPDELQLPEDVGVVPVGAITLWGGGAAPSGWADYTDANGLYILGAGGDYAVGDTGGEATFAGWSGDTTTNNAHEGGSASNFRTPTDIRIGSGSGTQVFSTGEDPPTDHSHTYNIGTIDPQVYRRNAQLIIKTGSASTTFPEGAQVLGLPGLSSLAVQRLTTAAGRLMRAAAANGDGGSASRFISFVSGSTSAVHKHFDEVNLFQYGTDLVGQTTQANVGSALGSHNHSYTLELQRNIKRRRVALYGATGDFPVLPGMICLWSGSLGSLPTDWVLCDGSGATPDLVDYFIEIANNGNENTAVGDNTLSINGVGSSVGHGHDGSYFNAGTPSTFVPHTDGATHTHTVTRSSAWMPPYYALAAIMYSPSA